MSLRFVLDFVRMSCADELQGAEDFLNICQHMDSSCCDLHPCGLFEGP